jgi:hypothetical protein
MSFQVEALTEAGCMSPLEMAAGKLRKSPGVRTTSVVIVET